MRGKRWQMLGGEQGCPSRNEQLGPEKPETPLFDEVHHEHGTHDVLTIFEKPN
jgi:hypothetical protein